MNNNDISTYYKVDNLSIVFGLLKYTEIPMSFVKDKAYWKVTLNEKDILWLTADEYRILEDSGMIEG
jgi:hypothetical protein